MKKILIIALTICLAFSLSITCLAAPCTSYHASSVVLDNGTIHINGWFYNAGNVTVGQFHSISVKVYDKNNSLIANADFDGSNLASIKLLPGQGKLWLFNITGVDPNADVSKWNVKTTYGYTNYETQELGEGIKVFYNGNKINFNAPPLAKDGRTMVPMRAAFEAMGASVQWDGATQSVTAIRNETTIKLTINSNTAYINGNAVALDTPAIAISGSTMVPVRFISEAMGCTVVWGSTDQVVGIYE